MFYEYVKGALELINNAEKEFTPFKDLSKKEIKIGCSKTLTKLILIDALKDFHNEYPNINIDITNDLTSDLINDLKLVCKKRNKHIKLNLNFSKKQKIPRFL